MFLLVKSTIAQTNTRPSRLLFVCTGNSCRSQMAEAWARALLGNTCEPCSAGITSHGLDTHAITVMAEKGIDISGCRSKTIADFSDRPFDGIVTLSERARVLFSYARYEAVAIHAGFAAPRKRLATDLTAGDGLDEYRRVRDDIETFVVSLSKQNFRMFFEPNPTADLLAENHHFHG